MEGHGHVDVALGGDQEDEVLVGHVDVGDVVEEKDGVLAVLLGGDDLGAEELGLRAGDVVFEDAVDQDLALLVDEHHGGDHGI